MLLTHTLMVQVIAFVLRPTSTYRAIELDVPALWLGVLSAGFAVVPLVLAVPCGHLVDRVGERRVMVAGSALLCLGAAMFLTLGHSVTGLLLGSVVLGTGHLCSVVGQQALVAGVNTPDRYDAAFGHYTFAASLGQAAGPGLILAFGGGRTIPDTDAIFLGTALLTVVPLGAALLIRSAARRPAPGDAATAGMRYLLRRPGLLRALTVSCVVIAAVDITLVYLPALGAERDIASGAIAALLALRAVASMTSRLFLGRLAARLGRKRLLVGSIVLAAGGLGVTPVPMPVWALAIAVTIAGFGLGAGQPLTMSWVAEATPPGMRGRAMSLRLTGNRLGQVMLPSAAGLLAAGTGAGGVLALTAGGLAAVAVTARNLNRPQLTGPPDAQENP